MDKMDVKREILEQFQSEKNFTDNCFEILYVDHGEVAIKIKKRSYEVRHGEMVFIRPNEAYALEATSLGAKVISLKINITEVWKSEVNNSLLLNINILYNNAIQLPVVYTKEDMNELDLKQLFYECQAEWEDKKSGFELIVKSNIEKLLIWILRISQQKTTEKHNNELKNEYIRRAIDYMDNNLREATASGMAEYIGISYTYFLKLFKDVTGCNYVQFAHSKRIQMAQMLLLDTRKNLDIIASEVGFSTTSHFIKVFRKNVGITPNIYRKQVLYGKMQKN